MDKPFSQACENNKQVILTQLQQFFAHCKLVLEIGTGTAQHATFFAPQLPHLTWQTSDMPDRHQGIHLWLEEFPATNLKQPVSFTLGRDPWPLASADAVFTANTTHIMQPSEAREMQQMVAENLPVAGVFCQYGPFNINGEFTSDSNRDFNDFLLAEGYGGIRDLQELQDWAGEQLTLTEVVEMPANNKLLVWHKS